jgi:TolB-like protein/DNA-binding winged helix-turn-helix (wHTH) protein/Tfp pilus assembly protein PilF
MERGPGVARFGGFEVDLDTGEVRRGGAVRGRLQDQPLRVLLVLLETPGELVDRGSLRRALWPDDIHVDQDQGLSKAVLKLRSIFGDSAESPRFIETIPRRGYRFLADVERALLVPAVPPNRRARRLAILSGAAAAAALVAFLSFPLRSSNPPNVGEGTTTSLAILPFLLLEPAAGDRPLGLGLADTLITKLSRLSRLSLRPTSSVVRYYAGGGADAFEVGRALGVDHVLEGSLQRRDGRLRVSVRLVRVADAKLLWAEVIEEPAGDWFELQDRISEEIVKRLSLRLSREEGVQLAKRHTQSIAAWEQYLRGRYFFEKRDLKSLHEAIGAFEKAADLDPGFALAYAGIAHAYGPLISFGDVPVSEGRSRIKDAAFRALELDDTLAEVHTAVALARSVDWDWEGEEREYLRAIELNPNYSLAFQWYGFLCQAQGRFQEALALRQKSWELDPTGLTTNIGLAASLALVGRLEEGRALVEKTMALEPDFRFVLTYMGVIHAQLGDFEKAEAFFEKAHALPSIAAVKARAGRVAEARAILERIGESASAYQIACIHAALGDADSAFTHLEQAYRERSSELMWLTSDWKLSPIRSDPRFHELVRRLGFRLPDV